MGEIKKHDSVKIISGLISADLELLEKIKKVVSKRFGQTDLESDVFLFNHTEYYQKEMGPCLYRKFLSFKRLRRPESLEAIKIFTNSLEKRFAKSGKRTINIDPGYLTLDKLVLLSTKNYSHRIYLNRGIYAEVTLYFKNGSYQPWQWSYPDYKTHDYIDFFKKVREVYISQIRMAK